MVVSFLPSQVGAQSQTPLSYTADPRKLLLSDISLCFSKLKYVFGILQPVRYGVQADPFDELYPSWKNIKAVILHAILVVAQLAFILSIPLFVFFPMISCLVYVAVFFVFNSGVCRVLNGTELVLEPNPAISGHSKHDSEYWIYMNGVSVGRDWLQSNIDRLSVTFGRRVHGVHNPTAGIIFDMVQCLVQRNFCYSTDDVREAYASIKKALYDEKMQKIVLILHSQGAIEGSLIIDWLLAELPQENLGRLEVYTFGNASTHFNNPPRSQARGAERGAFGSGTGRLPNGTATGARRYHSSKAIGHIEHYANTGDFVSQIGVLNNTRIRNRFMGRVFVSPYAGHLLNQHYLHQMFPLAIDRRSCCDANDFMDMPVDVSGSSATTTVAASGTTSGDGDCDADDAGEREGPAESMARSSGVVGRVPDAPQPVAVVEDVNSPVSPLRLASPLQPLTPLTSMTALKEGKKVLRVKDFSRLWLYRNGGTPPDDGLRRACTA